MCSLTHIDAADHAHARYSAARGALLHAVAGLAASDAWRGDGAGNLAAWLAARWQISHATARDLVREAEALEKRPALAAALCSGEISAEQCKAIEVLSDEGSGDDELWLESLWSWSLPELQREARKKVARELERRDGGVYLRMEHTPDERFLRGKFQLHPEDGAAVMKAIEAHIPEGTALRDWDKASAVALVQMCKPESTRSGPDTTVMLSVTDEPGGKNGLGVAAVGGGFVGAETTRRLACDARVQTIKKDVSGAILGIGRTSRTIPPWLRRVVMDRDGGSCTFPGCGRDRYLECHHVQPWSMGGPTEEPNLLTTCWEHHTLLHEGGWSVRGRAGPDVVWIRPDGTPFEPRVRPRVRVDLDTC